MTNIKIGDGDDDEYEKGLTSESSTEILVNELLALDQLKEEEWKYYHQNKDYQQNLHNYKPIIHLYSISHY